MRGTEKLNNMLDELNELGVKYANYKITNLKKAPFRDPESDEELKASKKITNETNKFMALFTFIMLVFLVLTIITSKNVLGITIMSILFIIPLILLIKGYFGKTQVFTGTAVYKQKRAYGNVEKRRYTYHISVIPDNGEKVIYTSIQVSRENYEQITEGTHVMVVNKENRACVIK